MSDPILIPKDFFKPIASERVLVPFLKRQLLTAAIIGGGGSDGRWVTASALREASHYWRRGPGNGRGDKPVRGILSVLLELELLGFIHGFEATGEGFLVRRKVAAA
jgi:hypothetical protein